MGVDHSARASLGREFAAAPLRETGGAFGGDRNGWDFNTSFGSNGGPLKGPSEVTQRSTYRLSHM